MREVSGVGWDQVWDWGVGRRQHTEQSKRPQDVHPRKRRKPQLQEIHDTPQQRRHRPGFRHQILQSRHFHLDP